MHSENSYELIKHLLNSFSFKVCHYYYYHILKNSFSTSFILKLFLKNEPYIDIHPSYL